MGATLVEQIAEHEGFRASPYDDATGRTLRAGDTLRGVATFGYGCTWLTEAEGQWLLQRRVSAAFTALRAARPLVERLSDARVRALVDMTVNLGLEGLLGFRRMWLALEAGDYSRAAAEMLSSKWARQVGRRALVLARMMEWSEDWETATRSVEDGGK